jgi:glycosyltransferase involved in cell wall biosynthesis
MISVPADRRSPTEKRQDSNSPENDLNLNVLWLHDTARRIGGCEHYICNTQEKLRMRGIRSTLLYGESGQGSLDMLQNFERAFPIVDLAEQLATIKPDVIYAHRVEGCDTLNTLEKSGIPTIRFFHDHKLFCPREHKYTVIGRQTCTRSIGPNCYSCLGVINRSPQWPGVRLQTVARLRAEQRAHDGLAGYVVASRYMSQHLVDHGFDSSRIHTIPLYVAEPSGELKSVTRADNLLLFVGQIVRGKGLDILLEAMRYIDKSVRLMVVGSGAQLDESITLARRLGLSEQVQFLGQKTQPELAELFQRATGLVVPSRSPETFGQVGIEAMSFGLPVVGTNVGGIGEWLSHERTGLMCQPNNARSLSAAITRLFADRELTQRMGMCALESSRTRFSSQQHIDRLERLFHNLSAQGKCK